ncbi:hypothetical protein O3P69_012286 [Scylla paramamosain]|uniref:C2H2-type domain-containing protein n=1 Tax=Scylla paramamosain TaxID=85552 RepID=A0AAW0TCF8_SCYPA
MTRRNLVHSGVEEKSGGRYSQLTQTLTQTQQSVVARNLMSSLWQNVKRKEWKVPVQRLWKVYTLSGNLRRYAEVHSLGPFVCDCCGKTFVQRRLLILHTNKQACLHASRGRFGVMSIHRGLKCEECGRNFSKPESLAAHTALHLTGGTIMCEVCNKLFSSKTRHNSSATTSCTPAQGTSCAGGAGGRTPQSGDLNKHIDAAYGGVGDSEFEEEEEEVLVVPIAHFSDKRKRYRSLGSLRKHQCEECGSRFSHRDVLIKHYSTYTCTKPFQCEEWSKAFARKDILATHALRHTKRRAFTCDDCGTDFWKKSSLRQHVMTHLLPEFKCEVCGKEFRVKVSLENHLRVQCGVKEFACVHCAFWLAGRLAGWVTDLSD